MTADQLLERLTTQTYPNVDHLAELGINRGEGRADLVLLEEIGPHMIELKGQTDTLVRLPRQVAIYNPPFERCSLAIHERHLARAEKMIPNHWGIITYPPLQVLRAAKPNPNRDPQAVLRQLWREKLSDLANRHGVHARPNMTHRALLAKTSQLPSEAIYAAWNQHLRQQHHDRIHLSAEERHAKF